MDPQEQIEVHFAVEYYLLDGGEVGRVKHDFRTDEYLDGEVLQGPRQWRPCPAATVVAEGEPLSKREAKRHVKSLGGRL